jgi:hypothetical protein
VIHSSTASDGEEMRSSYPYIEGTHTFYKLTLAANPKEAVEAAQKEASLNIATAYKKLMYLNFTDTGYAALNKLYSQANAEYSLASKSSNIFHQIPGPCPAGI